MSFVTVDQCKRIIQKYLKHTGRGGFETGQVLSVSPLVIRVGQKMELGSDCLYVTDNCIGLTKGGEVYRCPLQVGDGVLVLRRPDCLGGIQYILLDRIQPYTLYREVRPDG